MKKGKIYCTADTSSAMEATQIFECDLNGKNELELYSSEYNISDLRSSPDGSYFAFLTEQNNRCKLKVLDLSSFVLRELTGWEDGLEKISWSPDGQKFGCICKTGGDVHLKMFGLYSSYFSDERVFVDMVRNHNFIDWCGSTNQIAVNVNHYGFAVSYVYDYSSKTDTNFTAGNFCAYGLSWSPGGEKIAIAKHYNHLTVSSIYVLNKNGTNAVRITDDLFDDRFPCWQ